MYSRQTKNQMTFCLPVNRLTILSGLLAFNLCAASAGATRPIPMAQGLHQWPIMGGKLMLVVGTYQDTTSYRRSYSFYFKRARDEAWNQVPVIRKKGEAAFPWHSASGGEVTITDGIVVSRSGALYFVVADKRIGRDSAYDDKGDITATWNKLGEASDDDTHGPAYRLQPVFTRSYRNSSLTVEAMLAREATLKPAK